MHSYSKPKIVQMDDAVVLSNDVEKVAMSQMSSACSFPVYNNCQGQQSSVVNGQHLSVINGQQSSEVKGQQSSMANPDSTYELAALHSLIRRQVCGFNLCKLLASTCGLSFPLYVNYMFVCLE